MKRKIAAAATTGALALTVLAGTASAATGDGGPRGPFANADQCASYVAAHNQLGNWDCQGVAGPFGGWWAITGSWTDRGPYTSESWCYYYVREQGMLGHWDCEHVYGAYAGWYVFKGSYRP
ncbi:hypothetical protein [Nonomuraea aurantiaca]|uniref:hypothetical protein n=1 Tax=Nonomuraea aurantiaca TaxID=2878562 RepID=UPI001CDA3F29|nr:hypothetical protein [Nonomuraea aurantiaca]MCA2221494.1 hypothetical protein [Nonomuraea aurantiaca]